MEQVFIDRFIVPESAKQEFLERMKINRDFIKKLTGFIKDTAYGRTDEQGNLVCTTIAVWESEKAINEAKTLVQAKYQQQGFDLSAMLNRLGIQMERGLYKKMD